MIISEIYFCIALFVMLCRYHASVHAFSFPTSNRKQRVSCGKFLNRYLFSSYSEKFHLPFLPVLGKKCFLPDKIIFIMFPESTSNSLQFSDFYASMLFNAILETLEINFLFFFISIVFEHLSTLNCIVFCQVISCPVLRRYHVKQ